MPEFQGQTSLDKAPLGATYPLDDLPARLLGVPFLLCVLPTEGLLSLERLDLQHTVGVREQEPHSDLSSLFGFASL